MINSNFKIKILVAAIVIFLAGAFSVALYLAPKLMDNDESRSGIYEVDSIYTANELDVDGDMIPDKFEEVLGFDSNKNDSNGNGVSDYAEIEKFIINRFPDLKSPSSIISLDGDEYPDALERKIGLDANSITTSDDYFEAIIQVYNK